MKRRFTFILIGLFQLVLWTAHAHTSEPALADITVEGVVTDDDGESLIGVNVIVKGTNKGTSTDFDGAFTLEDVDENAVLIFSYVGYETQEIELNGRTQLTVTMQSNSATLDELVEIGRASCRERG